MDATLVGAPNAAPGRPGTPGTMVLYPRGYLEGGGNGNFDTCYRTPGKPISSGYDVSGARSAAWPHGRNRTPASTSSLMITAATKALSRWPCHCSTSTVPLRPRRRTAGGELAERKSAKPPPLSPAWSAPRKPRPPTKTPSPQPRTPPQKVADDMNQHRHRRTALITHRLTGCGCCRTDRHRPSPHPHRRFAGRRPATTSPATHSYAVTGWRCGHCVGAVSAELSALPGVGRSLSIWCPAASPPSPRPPTPADPRSRSPPPSMRPMTTTWSPNPDADAHQDLTRTPRTHI